MHYFSLSKPLHCTHYFSPNLLRPQKKLRLWSNFLLQFLLLAALSRCSPVSEPAAEPDPQPQPIADPEADAHYGHWGGSYFFYITLSYLLRKDWSDSYFMWSLSGISKVCNIQNNLWVTKICRVWTCHSAANTVGCQLRSSPPSS